MNNKQLSILYALLDMPVINNEYIKALNISKNDLEFLINEKLIETVTDDLHYRITVKGIKAIETKHLIVYNTEVAYDKLFDNISVNALSKFIHSLIDSNVLSKINNNELKIKLLSNLRENGYFTLNDKINESILENLIFHTNSLDATTIRSCTALFKTHVEHKYNIPRNVYSLEEMLGII